MLLMVIFLHRTVLKTFGLWKSSRVCEFHDGNFQIEKCDERTEKIIAQSVTDENPMDEVIYGEGSSDVLIVDEEKRELYKQELQTDFTDGAVRLKEVYKDRKALVKARERVFEDSQMNVVIKLRQDDVRLRLSPIDPSRLYPFNRLIEVDSSIEEPLEFFPAAFCMAIKRHAYITSGFMKLLKSKRTNARKQVDVYTSMFFYDFFNFLILLFGFNEFSVSSLPSSHPTGLVPTSAFR